MMAASFMRPLALSIAGLSALALFGNLSGFASSVPFYVSVGGLVLAGAILSTPGLGAFLRFFVVFYGFGYLGLIALLLAGGLLGIGWIAAIPPLTAFTAAAFGVLAILLGRLPVTRTVFRIADPYFETDDRRAVKLWPLGTFTARERWIAFVLLGIIILINLAQVGISVRLNQWNREWFDAIQAKNAGEFWRLLLQVWVGIVAVLIVSNIIEFVLVSVFKIRWRDWMTQRLVGWMKAPIIACNFPARSITLTSAFRKTSTNTSRPPTI
jgi:vitamin B12/bleomycin/antimicrobial peptide transport system ATP-binding/permease protein